MRFIGKLGVYKKTKGPLGEQSPAKIAREKKKSVHKEELSHTTEGEGEKAYGQGVETERRRSVTEWGKGVTRH